MPTVTIITCIAPRVVSLPSRNIILWGIGSMIDISISLVLQLYGHGVSRFGTCLRWFKAIKTLKRLHFLSYMLNRHPQIQSVNSKNCGKNVSETVTGLSPGLNTKILQTFNNSKKLMNRRRCKMLSYNQVRPESNAPGTWSNAKRSSFANLITIMKELLILPLITHKYWNQMKRIKESFYQCAKAFKFQNNIIICWERWSSYIFFIEHWKRSDWRNSPRAHGQFYLSWSLSPEKSE